MKTVFYFSLFYLICLHRLWKEGAMKFAGKQMRKCYNPICDTQTTRVVWVEVNGKERVVHCCLSCKPFVVNNKVIWSKR